MRIAAMVIVFGVLVGCAAPQQNTDARIRVTVTTGIVGDVVRSVGGDHVRIAQIIPNGVDPHSYQATAADVRKLSDAQIIFFNGLNLEGRMTDVFARMEVPTVALGDAVDRAQLRAYGEAFDPHIWFDVSLWKQTVRVVRDALVAVDPAHSSAYTARARAYEETLQALHEEVSAMIRAYDRSRRVLVTAHDAFGYFGAAYGVDVYGVQGINTNSEASSRDVTRLRDMIVARGVRAVFVESSVSPRTIEAVIAGAKARGHDVRIGGTLYSDALGGKGAKEQTYVDMVRYNVRTIIATWTKGGPQ
ncbi:MAG: zinc ABC transporter substrate-binding protein [Paenibacillaceae bacterium]|jgi:manganese/zinc/iron transport system substrate-binding protein|nr:zinc ABC transporter substrate-binding protein [Paenibacillaceae bacterium]